MEYFIKTKYVRLKSLHNKYLVTGKDGVSIKQSRKGGNSIQAYWTVELVNGRPNLICLRSCHGKLLTATNEPFLLGWTGDKILQTSGTGNDPLVQWEPLSVSDHPLYIRLRTPLYNKFLRANGGTPPWRKSVTVDIPGSAVTQDWTMWAVDIVLPDLGIGIDICSRPSKSESTSEDMYLSLQETDLSDLTGCSSPASSTSSALTYKEYDLLVLPGGSSPASSTCSALTYKENDPSVLAGGSSPASSTSSAHTYKSGIQDLENAKTIRLLTHKNKYLAAHEDGELVSQSRHGNSKQTYWTVENISSVKGGSLVRLKSCYQKYLTASEDNFLLGATGKKVKQTLPKRLDYSIEWGLIRDGKKVKIKTWDGNYLRANGGVPPWRNSVTHDHPSNSPIKDRVLWKIEVIEVNEN